MSKRLHAYEFFHPVCVCVCVCATAVLSELSVQINSALTDTGRDRQLVNTLTQINSVSALCLSVSVSSPQEVVWANTDATNKQRLIQRQHRPRLTRAHTHTHLHKQIHTQKSRRIKTKWLHCGCDGCVSHEDIKHTKVLTWALTSRKVQHASVIVSQRRLPSTKADWKRELHLRVKVTYVQTSLLTHFCSTCCCFILHVHACTLACFLFLLHENSVFQVPC